jgi:hypothetical protein
MYADSIGIIGVVALANVFGADVRNECKRHLIPFPPCVAELQCQNLPDPDAKSTGRGLSGLKESNPCLR